MDERLSDDEGSVIGRNMTPPGNRAESSMYALAQYGRSPLPARNWQWPASRDALRHPEAVIAEALDDAEASSVVSARACAGVDPARRRSRGRARTREIAGAIRLTVPLRLSSRVAPAMIELLATVQAPR